MKKRAGRKVATRPRPTVAQVKELEKQLAEVAMRLGVRTSALERERLAAAQAETNLRRQIVQADAKASELRNQLNQATADSESMRRELADWRRRGGVDVTIRQELEQTVDQLRGVKQRALGLGKQLAEWFSSDGPLVSEADGIGHDVGNVMHRLAALLKGGQATHVPAGDEAALVQALESYQPGDRLILGTGTHRIPPSTDPMSRITKLEHRVGYQAEALNELARMHDRQRERHKQELRELEQRLNNLLAAGTLHGCQVPSRHEPPKVYRHEGPGEPVQMNGNGAALVPGGTPV